METEFRHKLWAFRFNVTMAQPLPQIASSFFFGIDFDHCHISADLGDT